MTLQAENTPAPDKAPSSNSRAITGLSVDDLITLNEEIAGMARAGLPLDQGLAAMAREMKHGRLQQVTAELAADLRSGLTLPEALERQGKRVPPFYSALVAAGIRSGQIGDVLATLTAYARAIADLRATIIGALFYPVVIIVLALALFAFICFLLIPQFEKIFNDFRLRLPAVTSALLEISRHALEIFVLPLVLVVLCIVVFKLTVGLTAWGRRMWAQALYALPVLGMLLRSARLYGFTDLLGILVDHKVPLPEAYILAGKASSDPLMAQNADLVYRSLCQGMPLGEALREHRLVPELIAWMTALGERRGTLGKTLHQVADMYRRQAEMRASLLRNVLPPFLILVTSGVLAILFVLAVFLPMFALLEALARI
jgi:type II secretory pathway component PulF